MARRPIANADHFQTVQQIIEKVGVPFKEKVNPLKTLEQEIEVRSEKHRVDVQIEYTSNQNIPPIFPRNVERKSGNALVRKHKASLM